MGALQAHSAKVEQSIALGTVHCVQARSMRNGREKLGLAVEHGGGDLCLEAVSERAKLQWIEALQSVLAQR